MAVLLALGFLFHAPGSLAAEPIDLGDNLSYLRVHALADAAPSLRAALSAGHALVLDLRYSTASDESVAALRSDLALHPKNAPLFILLSPSTPPAVAEAVAQTPGAGLSLGVPGTRSARVTVQAGAEADRRAYDALEAGTPVDALISGKIEKERFDEATLVEEFKNGNRDAEPPDPPDPTAPADDRTSGSGPAPDPSQAQPPSGPASADHRNPVERPTDRVLQRAVHLHHALLALRR